MSTRRAIDIPEVLIHIAAHLAPADLALACRVSTAWFTLLFSQLWRTIYPDHFTDGGLLAALPRYSTFVREFYCPRLLPLVDPGPGLRRLTAFTTPEIGKHNVQLISTLLKRNTDLRDVHIRCRLVIDTECFSQLIDALTGLQRLENLDMDTHEISTSVIFLILNNLPGLKHLQLEETKKRPKWTLSKPPPLSDPSSPPPLFGLKQLRVVCRHLPLEPIFEIVQTTPDLTSLQIVGLDGDQQPNSGVLKKLAHTVHESCPRLRDLLVDGDEMSLHNFYYFLSLLDLDNRIRSTIAVRDRWMPFRTLHFDNNSPFGNELLDLVLSGSEVLQDSLENLRIDNSIFTKSSSASVVEILTTFRKLRTLSLKKTSCVVQLADLFNSVSLDGGRKMGKKIKPWASKDLRNLNIWIEGEFRSWCPPGVVNEKDDYLRDPLFKRQFPLYDQLKAQLDGYPSLDQRQIRYTYITYL